MKVDFAKNIINSLSDMQDKGQLTEEAVSKIEVEENPYNETYRCIISMPDGATAFLSISHPKKEGKK